MTGSFQLLHQIGDVVEVDARKHIYVAGLYLEPRRGWLEGPIEAILDRLVEHIFERAFSAAGLRFEAANDVVLKCHRSSFAHITDDTRRASRCLISAAGRHGEHQPLVTDHSSPDGKPVDGLTACILGGPGGSGS